MYSKTFDTLCGIKLCSLSISGNRMKQVQNFLTGHTRCILEYTYYRFTWTDYRRTVELNSGIVRGGSCSGPLQHSAAACHGVAFLDYGGITTTIKHAIKLTIKLKTSSGPARLAQLLQPSWAFCCKLQPMTACWRYAVIGCNLQQNANEGCNSCTTSLAGLVLSFIVSVIACFIVVVIPPLQTRATTRHDWSTVCTE